MDDRLPLPGIAGATAFFSVTVCFASFGPVAGLWVDSPESVLNGALHDASGPLPTGVFVALCGLVLGMACIGLALWSRPAALLGVTIAIFAFGGSVAGYAFERLLTSNTPQGIPVTGQPRVRNWVDRSATARSRCSPIRSPGSGARARSCGGTSSSGTTASSRRSSMRTARGRTRPSRPESLRLDFERGVFDDTEHSPPFVLAAENDSRFEPEGRGDDLECRARAAQGGAAVPRLLGEPRPGAGRLDPAWATRHGANLRKARCGDRRRAARRAAGGERANQLPTRRRKWSGESRYPVDRADDRLHLPSGPRGPHARDRALGDSRRAADRARARTEPRNRPRSLRRQP